VHHSSGILCLPFLTTKESLGASLCRDAGRIGVFVSRQRGVLPEDLMGAERDLPALALEPEGAWGYAFAHSSAQKQRPDPNLHALGIAVSYLFKPEAK
jgi:hypothetical protein